MVPEIGGTHANGINSLSEVPPSRKEEKNDLGSNSLSVSGRDSENNVTAVYAKHTLKTHSYRRAGDKTLL